MLSQSWVICPSLLELMVFCDFFVYNILVLYFSVSFGLLCLVFMLSCHDVSSPFPVCHSMFPQPVMSLSLLCSLIPSLSCSLTPSLICLFLPYILPSLSPLSPFVQCEAACSSSPVFLGPSFSIIPVLCFQFSFSSLFQLLVLASLILYFRVPHSINSVFFVQPCPFLECLYLGPLKRNTWSAAADP